MFKENFRLHSVAALVKRLSPKGLGEKAEDQKVPYLWGRCVPRKNEKQEWVMWSRGKGYRGERHASQTDKTFLSIDAASGCLPFSHNATLYHHFWSVTWQPAPGCALPNGISGKLVTMVISCGCGCACSLPCAEYISQPSDSISSPVRPLPTSFFSFNSHYSSCHHLLLHYPDCIRPSITHWAHSKWINHSGWQSNQSLDAFSHLQPLHSIWDLFYTALY